MMRNPFKQFHPVALHDSYRGETVGLILSQTIPLVTSASSTFSAIKFRPSLEGFYAVNNAAATITSTTFGNFSEQFEYQAGQQLLTNTAKFRILAYAVECSYTGAQDAMSGTITHIYRHQTGNLPDDASTWDDTHATSGIQPISRKQFTYVIRPVDSPRFQSLNANCEDYIGGLGLAFNNVNFSDMLVKTRIFVEVIPQSESALADTAKPSPYHGTPVQTPNSAHGTFTTSL